MPRRTASLSLSVILLTAFFGVVSTKDAYAYMDPGTGSFLIQVLLGGLFASLFVLKVFWMRVTGTLSRVLSKLRIVKLSKHSDKDGP